MAVHGLNKIGYSTARLVGIDARPSPVVRFEQPIELANRLLFSAVAVIDPKHLERFSQVLVKRVMRGAAPLRLQPGPQPALLDGLSENLIPISRLLASLTTYEEDA